MKNKKNKVGYLIVLLIIFLVASQIFYLNPIDNSQELNDHGEIHSSAQESYQEQWISNPNFVSSENWTSIKGELGDPNDVNAYISNGAANYDVLGFKDQFTFEENYYMGASWVKTNHPDYPVDPTFGNIVAGEGFRAEHSWDDHNANQVPSVQWEHNFSLPVNMSDYIIKSASVSAGLNATVDSNIDTVADGVAGNSARIGYNVDTYSVGDYIRFYVSISDLQKTKTYEIAHTQSTTLGYGNAGSTDNLAQQVMSTLSQADLIYYLSSVLETDYRNFTLIVGIRFNCEDNVALDYDYDDFDRAVINSINLTFTYEKTINQQTSASWNQEGNKISDSITISPYTNFTVTEAILNFEYEISDTWPSSSPNSEIRILMNNIIHTETIKLSTATTSIQNASQDGFDITPLISDDVNLSIQVFLADDFELNQTITVSIDNVILNISYTVFFADYQTTLQLFLNGEDKTYIELPIGQMLNITVKYTNQTGGHIPGANIQLTGEGIIEALNETVNQYTIRINVSQELSMGNNNLNLEATKANYETRLINPTINVRNIRGEIKTLSGETAINITSGADFPLQIILNDTDNNELIQGATVTYTWDLDPTPRVLIEDNGVYEGLIVNPPDGLYTITIHFVGDDYDFVDLPITLIVGVYIPPEPKPDLDWLIYLLIFGLGGAIIGFATIFSLYIKYWRFPPLVRKIRALRKKVSKTKKTKPVIVSKREEIIKNNLQDSVKILSLELIQPEKIDKIEKINLEKEGVN